MSESATQTAGPAFWQDRATQISLGLAIALNLLLFALVLLANQQLEEAVAGAVNISDGADRFAAPANALILPIIGLLSWLIGGVLAYFYFSVRDEAPMATIIWGAVILIEVATWVPVLNLLIDL